MGFLGDALDGGGLMVDGLHIICTFALPCFSAPKPILIELLLGSRAETQS